MAPTRLVFALLAELPRVLAEESLRLVADLRLGGGWMKRADAERAQARLQRRVNGGRRPRGLPATPENLEAFGIKVRHVPAPAAS